MARPSAGQGLAPEWGRALGLGGAGAGAGVGVGVGVGVPPKFFGANWPEHAHLRRVLPVLRLDRIRIGTKPLARRPVRGALPHGGILLHVVQHVLHCREALRITGDAEFAQEQLGAGLLRPLGDRRQTLHADVRVGHRAVVRAAAVAIEILVHLECIVVQRIVDRAGIDRRRIAAAGPAPCTGPVGAGHQDFLCRADLADGRDRGVVDLRLLLGGLLVRLVHQAEDDVGIAFERRRHIAPERGKTAGGRAAGANQVAPGGAVIVRIQNDVHAKRFGLADHLLKIGHLRLIERAVLIRF